MLQSEFGDIIDKHQLDQAEPSVGPVDEVAAQTRQLMEAEYLELQLSVQNSGRTRRDEVASDRDC